MDFHLHSKIHDAIVAFVGGGTLALSLTEIDTLMKIVVSILSSIFILTGLIARWTGKKGNQETKDD